ncbi:MAG: prepilin-type N-terminal cleavage/methylation domain-containing protein [Candidatus Riflebacteria bacterium]|nr:prepilin-type N-terminal cleavage/methylation domain-containing protein [Candidatus Riflebacteria bacterium]
MSKTNLAKRGVTLIEVLIALLLGSLMIIPIFTIFGVSEKVTYKSTNEVVACNLALQRIEEFKSRPFAELRKKIEQAAADPLNGPYTEVVFPLEANAYWNSPGVEYLRETRISFYPNINPDVSLSNYEQQKLRIRIRAIVKFTETVSGQKKEKVFELATIVTDENYASGLVLQSAPETPANEEDKP